MRKLILNWLFGTDDIQDHLELLRESRGYCQKLIDETNEHIETIKRAKENINTILKLIKICENHGIDVDKEIKEIEL